MSPLIFLIAGLAAALVGLLAEPDDHASNRRYVGLLVGDADPVPA